MRSFINDGNKCEYFFAGELQNSNIIYDDSGTVPAIRNNLNLDDKRIWIKQPVLHAGLARVLAKRPLAYNFHLRRIHKPKCMFIVMSGNISSGGEHGKYCYDMKAVNQPATKNCDMELAIEYMESIPIKVVIAVNISATPILNEISHKMPVITYNSISMKFRQICRDKHIQIHSLKTMKNPWKACPIRLSDQAAVPIIKG